MIIGVGLSRTGTTTLNKALCILGLNSIHYHPHLLKNALWGQPQSFRVYDDVDAVTDLPAAHFYKEILKAYPNSKTILTIRDEDSWFNSVSHHYHTINYRIDSLSETPERKEWLKETSLQIRKVVYGSTEVNEEYISRYRYHNKTVKSDLVMNITEGDGWKPLCQLLDKPIPDVPFPFENRRFKTLNYM